MKICRWCDANEQDADFIGRLCDSNPTGDEHEMVEVVEVVEEPVEAECQ